MRPVGWNSRSPKKLSGDYVATDNGVVPDGKTSEVGKMDSLPDGLVVKRNARVVPLSGDEVMSHPEGMSSGGVPEWNGPESYRHYVPPPGVTDLAGTGVPAVAGMDFFFLNHFFRFPNTQCVYKWVSTITSNQHMDGIPGRCRGFILGR